jgi:hypothetical protein
MGHNAYNSTLIFTTTIHSDIVKASFQMPYDTTPQTDDEDRDAYRADFNTTVRMK